MVTGGLRAAGPIEETRGAQKLVGLLITIIQAVAYVVSGMYGDVRALLPAQCLSFDTVVCIFFIRKVTPVGPVADYRIRLMLYGEVS